MAVFSLFVASGCNQENESNTGTSFTSTPSITMAPNPNTPLVGILNLTTDVPTRISLDVSDGSDSWEINFDEFNIAHSLPILGLRPGKEHTIRVRAIDEDNNESAADFVVTTDPLPEGFPEINVVSMPEKMEPGVTLFSVRSRGANAEFVLVAVNERGEVVWYHKPGTGISDLRRIKNGNLLFISSGDGTIVELDMLGNEVRRWHPVLTSPGQVGSIPVVARSFHHEVFEMESGNLLVLSQEIRSIENYPSSEDDPDAPTATADVIGDVVVEFTRDGTVVNQWSMLDLLDPLRIGYLSVVQGPNDWSHGNGVIHDPRDDSIIVSLRHQDAVVKFSRQTGELIWILGPHENWDPDEFGNFLLTPTVDSEFFWPYHQHAPMLNFESDTILVYDNGNFRASPFDEKLAAAENFSRAVEYSIDEETMEITQVWEYGQFAEEILYTRFIGDADFLPQTGNVLITFGGITQDEEGNPTDSGGSNVSVRIIEVTHTTPPEKVFDLSIFDASSYRSERLPSLYP